VAGFPPVRASHSVQLSAGLLRSLNSMFTFFTIVFAIVWAVVSFILLFKVWDNIGPIVLSFSKSHIVQLLAMAIIFLIIWGVPGWLWMKIFG